MANRTKKGQETHDRKVAETARRLERTGYKVQAHLPGQPRPPIIGGHIPDIMAKKPGTTLIREVETPSTVKKDQAQHTAFRNFAAKKPGTSFRVLVAKKKKK